MKSNVPVVCVCSRCNILISGKIIKGMPVSVASGTPDIYMNKITTRSVTHTMWCLTAQGFVQSKHIQCHENVKHETVGYHSTERL